MEWVETKMSFNFVVDLFEVQTVHLCGSINLSHGIYGAHDM